MGRFSQCESDSSSEASIDPCLIADGEYGMPKKCYCGGEVFMQTSYTKNDPGRRYFSCRRSENEGYHIRKLWDHVVEDELEILHCDIERLREKVQKCGSTGHLNYLTTDFRKAEETIAKLKEGQVQNEDDFRKAEEAIEKLKEGQVQNVEQIAKLDKLVGEVNKQKICAEMMFLVAALVLLLGLILIWFK